MKKITLILFFITSFIFAQQREPEYYVAELLQTHRAVMLGDMNHHLPFYSQNVINVLNAWLDIVRRDSAAHNITLILECESSISELLNDTINERNFHEILKYGYGYFPNIEDIEFCSGLVSVFSRVNRLNARGRHITFKIKGFEDYEVPLKTKTNREGELWFVNVRDSVLGEKVSGYMDEHPGENILIFYGGMHLIDEKTIKSGMLKDEGNSEGEGYMLSHYLKNEFGDKEIVTISQMSSLAQGCDTIVNFDTTYLRLDKTWYVKPFSSKTPSPLSSLFGRRFIEATITAISNMDLYSEGYKAKNQKANYIRSLNFITGKDFLSTGEIEYWYGLNNYEPFARINSFEFWAQCFSLLTKDPRSPQLRIAFLKMGFLPGIIDTSFVPDYAYWFGDYRKSTIENILTLNSIAMLWLGYPDEKLQAANFLKNKTGWSTENPHYYLRWYRKNYFGVDY